MKITSAAEAKKFAKTPEEAQEAQLESCFIDLEYRIQAAISRFDDSLLFPVYKGSNGLTEESVQKLVDVIVNEGYSVSREDQDLARGVRVELTLSWK